MVAQLIMQNEIIASKATNPVPEALSAAPEYREGGWGVNGLLMLRQPVRKTPTPPVSSYIAALIVC
jgi:hypothetical protein